MNLLTVSPEIIDRNNRWFAFVVAVGLGVLGSIVSVMISVAFGIIFFLMLFGHVRKSGHPDIWRIAQLFLIYFAVSSIVSLIHFDNGENLDVIIKRLPFLAFFPLVMALSYTTRANLRQYLENGAATGAVLALVYVAVELGTGGARAEGFDGNPGPFALSMCIGYALCLFGLVRSDEKRRAIWMLIGASAAIVCVLASGIRAMWPALLGLLIIAMYSRSLARLKSQLKLLVVGFFIVCAVTYLIAGDMIVSRINFVMHDIDQVMVHGQYNNSLGERLVMWKFAWLRVPDVFWLGLGEAGASDGLDVFAVKELGYFSGWSHFHNFAVNAMMRGGVFELTATLALLFGPLLIAWKHRAGEISRYGIAFMAAITLIYFESGILGITFGHDIMDHLFTYMMAVGTWLTIGSQSEETGRVD